MPKYDLEKLRGALPIERVLHLHGVRAHRGRARCPLAGPCNGKSGESMSITHDGRRFHCFRCQAAGDVFDLISGLESIPFAEAVARCAALAGARPAQTESSIPRRPDSERERREHLGKLWRSMVWLRDRLRVVAADANVPAEVRGDARHAAGQCEFALDAILDHDMHSIADLLSWFSR